MLAHGLLFCVLWRRFPATNVGGPRWRDRSGRWRERRVPLVWPGYGYGADGQSAQDTLQTLQ